MPLGSKALVCDEMGIVLSSSSGHASGTTSTILLVGKFNPGRCDRYNFSCEERAQYRVLIRLDNHRFGCVRRSAEPTIAPKTAALKNVLHGRGRCTISNSTLLMIILLEHNRGTLRFDSARAKEYNRIGGPAPRAF
jgi:hypothetical protein